MGIAQLASIEVYKTHDEAIAARKEHLKHLREMMPKVKAFLNEIDSISPTDDFSFNRSDYRLMIIYAMRIIIEIVTNITSVNHRQPRFARRAQALRILPKL